MKRMIGAAAVALLAAAPAFAQEQLTNGGFETGTFAGWTTSVQAGSSGNLNISTPGAPSPISGFDTAGNASGGAFYAVTDQTGPGAYALSQSFTTPTGLTSLTLSFQLFANNHGNGTTVNPAGLDYTADPNQHARVDLLRVGADPFSTDPDDVLANFYLGADDPANNPNPYADYSFDLLPYVTSGGTYVIRFGEVDNQGFFNLGVDNVSVFAVAGVPEPATWGLMILGFGAVGATMRRRSAKVSFA